MYLSQLEVVGFKSFAQKTNLRFNDGMTAIVGPNGCGKSNVVDAIRWVLGEQKTSALRSDKMENVIFNGTKNRKPLGLAEVSMTIENTKGILPTEYSEITITRRLFRNGDSQYLLNKTNCRLRDIVDLFMDTGMGPNAYSVIELKMIETILSDRTEERRKLFEEAAGVTKYKTRRKEAERRLSSVQGDLTRVHDILAEVQKSVRSLSRQADRAKKYREISDELNAVERKIIRYEFATLTGEIVPLEQQLVELRAAKERLEQELVDQESIVSEMEEQQSDIGERLSEAESRRTNVNQRVSETTNEP
jgi:chromosome segregation protein